MKRDLEELVSVHYDVLVVGGGIYGACVARDAALRGMSVALLEKEDFGHATSANSLKIIHGGLRYLQDGSLRLVRMMARERKAWLRIAPHLVHPLPCLMPTTKKVGRSRALMALGVRLNDLLSYDRNRGMNELQYLPAGRILGRAEARRLFPGLRVEDITGGVLWHDAQVTNTERLLLAVVASAATAGARVANYVEVSGSLREKGRVEGVTAVDKLSGERLTIRAQLVIVAAGVWRRPLLELLGLPRASSGARPSLAINLVTRQLRSDYAVAIPADMAPDVAADLPLPRTLFIVPWQQSSLIGTLHLPCQEEGATEIPVSEELVAGFLAGVNAAYPQAQLRREDVRQVHAGFLPAHETAVAAHKDAARDGAPSRGAPRLLRESEIIDHEQSDGIGGLISVQGVKYTTARHTAQKVVDLAARKLKRDVQSCKTDRWPVAGGDTGDLAKFIERAEKAQRETVDGDVLRHLIRHYGTGYERVLDYAGQNPEWRRRVCATAPILGAEIVYAVREEMAVRLSDVLLRRTSLGATGAPDADCARRCAGIMAGLLGWDAAQQQDEIEQVYAGYGQQAPAALQAEPL